MEDFAIGDTVQVTVQGAAMTGSVGTVVHLDTSRGLYLVRVGAAVQDYFPPEHLELFAP
ncbi:hypothetical protein [Pseudokineococcus lusitanus]|uniref:KOW motif-containing protein n=1 Tax=Pseudokineococcus lusitanus TaxID=763993 RepID=A0A3N1GAI2_9ACTN|nr:hypothetical protein [Pseudokineococcus lusitanus]ROP27221.1 hypothetical protein EDC03_2745 [Pseudokineococcus lusitanus]